MASQNLSNLTVQEVGSPVPAPIGGEQAGSQASSSYDRSAAVVDHLATEAFTTSSEERRKETWELLGEEIRILHEFVMKKRNTHNEIKSSASKIRMLYEKLTRKDENPEQSAAGNSTGTQTSTSLCPVQEEDIGAPLRPQHKTSKKKKKDIRPKINNDQVEGQVPAPTAMVPPRNRMGEQWQMVNNKKKRKKKNKAIEHKRRPKPPRPDALIVTAKEGSSYADILRTIKSDPELQDIGEKVQKIRKCHTGSLLLVLDRKAQDKTEIIRKAIAEKMVDKAEVTSKRDSITLELKDLDELTSAEEVYKALQNQIEGAETVDISVVKSLRAAYGGTQTAVVVLPTDLARKAIDLGNIRVGWISSRVREKISPQRCFRCLAYGHLARYCKGPDRTKLCFRCGEEGHPAKGCVGEPRCLLCIDGGNRKHATGGFGCPVYQRAVESATKSGR